ncbi:MAG: putative MPP superfamily phosphohydrolase [Bacteroidia bacterium]|jgi:predicted MPP superfamily phosphohydrolase
MRRAPFFVFILIFYLLLDYYVFQAVKVVVESSIPSYKRLAYTVYWSLTAFTFIAVVAFLKLDSVKYHYLRTIMMSAVVINFVSKFVAVLFIFMGDIARLGQWAYNGIVHNGVTESSPGKGIPRSEFLSKTALIAGAVPSAIFSFGIISGAYDYRVRRKTIVMPNLPKAFDGIRLAQLSDIHSGSFYNKTAVKGGIDMLLGEKPDVIFFTGDLVNNESREVKDYVDIFSKAKAPLGVYSTLGNHDYGDYANWSSENEKRKNLQDLIQTHKNMGWDILLDESRYLETGGEKLGIIGVQNWGAKFAKYGNLEKAARNVEAPVKILLSHDPTHWDAQVRSGHKDIDLTLSGHTHGFQFGVEIGNFKWSPAQYMYKQWADLYQEENQYLYVNRGYGFLGYPGRVGILPEITIIELKSV